jgi:GGDEF domain-containing protein
VLKESSRKTDYVCRFGGDEFMLIGHIVKEENAEEIMQRILKNLDKVNRTGNLPFNLSLSYGYMICSRNDRVTIDTIMNEADRKMYEMKNEKMRMAAAGDRMEQPALDKTCGNAGPLVTGGTVRCRRSRIRRRRRERRTSYTIISFHLWSSSC